MPAVVRLSVLVALGSLLPLLAAPATPAGTPVDDPVQAPAGTPAEAPAATLGSSLPDPLDLATAVELALAASDHLLAADADRRRAAAALDEARAAGLPRVELTETYLRTDNPVLVFGGLLGQERFTEANFDIDSLNRPDPLTNFRTGVAVGQPLWTGGRIRHGVEAARWSLAGAEAGRERTRQEVVHQVVDAFAAALVAEERLQVAREAREAARAAVKVAGDLFEGGLVVESDLLQAQVRESETEEMVIRAESAVEVTRAALELAIGTPLESAHRLLPPSPADFPPEPVEELLALALDRRPDLQAAEAGVSAAAESAAGARGARLPELRLEGGYELNGVDLASFDGDNWSLAVALRFTAFDGFAARARQRQAEESRERAARMRDLFVDRIELEVRRARAEVVAARQRLEQSERAVALASRSLEIVEDRYREGLTTLVELLEAQSRRTEARSRQTAARQDLLRFESRLELAVGTL